MSEGGFTRSSQPGASGGEGGALKSSSLRPVTIKQLKSATQTNPNSEYLIDGKAFGRTVIVGSVSRISRANTFYRMKIEDGTDEVELRWFHNRAEDDEQLGGDGEQTDAQILGFDENQIVQAIVDVKSFTGMTTFNGVNFQLVSEDYMNYHLLLAAKIHKQLTVGLAGGEAPKAESQMFVSQDAGANLEQRVLHFLKEHKHSAYRHDQLADELGVDVVSIYPVMANLTDKGTVYEADEQCFQYYE